MKGRGSVAEKATNIMTSRKQWQIARGKGQDATFRGILPVTYFPQPGHILQISQYPFKLKTKHRTREPWGSSLSLHVVIKHSEQKQLEE